MSISTCVRAAFHAAAAGANVKRGCRREPKPHTLRKIRLRYMIHTGTKQTAVKLTE